jgi:hypothetical protein
MQKNAINFVEQMNKMDIRNPYNAFRSNMILEALYGGTVFTENAKKIARCTYT